MLTTLGTVQSRVNYSSGQLCTIACVSVQFIVRRQVVELASKHHTWGHLELQQRNRAPLNRYGAQRARQLRRR
jgi:hypothetical protein